MNTLMSNLTKNSSESRKTIRDLASDTDLTRIARKRHGKKIEHPDPPKHPNPKILKDMIKHEEDQGWELKKEYKTSSRMHKDKPADIQLEDDVWTLFYRMGFHSMSPDRQVYVKDVGPKGDRQLDIVARDDDTIYFVECTHKVSEGTKSVKHLIARFSYLKKDIEDEVRRSFKDGANLEIKFIIATRGIEWNNNDIERAVKEDIGRLTESDINYYMELTSLLKEASRYQFHARYLQSRENAALEKEVLASRIKVGENVAYHFLASPYDILRISSVSHRARTSDNDFNSYQRMVSANRLEDIGRFIKQDGTFPTNIVCNFKVPEGDLKFTAEGEYEGVTFGKLSLPTKYGCLLVIDGQHRLYGYAYAETDFRSSNAAVSILAYQNLSIDEEIRIFVDINTKQKKVKTSLANEIKASIGLNHDDARDKITAICQKVVREIDENQKSPLKGHIKSELDRKDRNRFITSSNVHDGLQRHNLVGSAPKNKEGQYEFQPGFLAVQSGKPETTVNKAATFMILVLRLVSQTAASNWSKRDKDGGFWFSNIGYRTLCHLLSRVMPYLNDFSGADFRSKTAEQCFKVVEPYIRESARYIEGCSYQRVELFRNRGGAGGIQKNAQALETYLHESSDLKYDPEEVMLRSQQKQKADIEDARSKLNGSFDKMKHLVRHELEEIYSIDDMEWWFKGVPPEIQTQCQQAKIKKKNDVWDNVQSDALVKIVEMSGNWKSFKQLMSESGYKGVVKDDVSAKLRKAFNIRDELDEDTVLEPDEILLINEVYALIDAMAAKVPTGEDETIEPA